MHFLADLQCLPPLLSTAPFHQCSIIPPPMPPCENERRVPFLPALASRQTLEAVPARAQGILTISISSSCIDQPDVFL